MGALSVRCDSLGNQSLVILECKRKRTREIKSSQGQGGWRGCFSFKIHEWF